MPTYLNERGTTREMMIGRIRHTAARMRDLINQRDELDRIVNERRAILSSTEASDEDKYKARRQMARALMRQLELRAEHDKLQRSLDALRRNLRAGPFSR